MRLRYTIHIEVETPSREAADEALGMMRWFRHPDYMSNPALDPNAVALGGGVFVDAEDGIEFGETEELAGTA